MASNSNIIVAGDGNGDGNGNGFAPPRERVTVVIPAKDEARNVAWVLRRLPDNIDEVILVDGHSTDDTVAVARAARPDVIVTMERARGKGAAMRTGMDLATGEIIVTIDADGSMDPAEVGRYVSAARDADLVKGSRFADHGGSADISLYRRCGNAGLRYAVNWLYGAHLTDLCYGYCAVRRAALPVLNLRCDGFEIETEMTVRALREGLRVTEVASFEAPRRYGTSHLNAVRDGFRVLGTLLRERPPRRPRPAWAKPQLSGKTISVTPPVLALPEAPALPHALAHPEALALPTALPVLDALALPDAPALPDALPLHDTASTTGAAIAPASRTAQRLA
jgi:Glycosyl transferase family 2